MVLKIKTVLQLKIMKIFELGIHKLGGYRVKRNLLMIKQNSSLYAKQYTLVSGTEIIHPDSLKSYDLVENQLRIERVLFEEKNLIYRV